MTVKSFTCDRDDATAGSNGSHVNHSVVTAAILMGTLGMAALLVLPGFVGILKRGYGFDDTQLGYLSSAELAGMTIGSMFGAKFVPIFGIRRGSRWGLLFAAIMNGAAATLNAYRCLVVACLLAGVGAGFAVAACFIVLGQSKYVDRNFSLFFLVQLVFAAAALQWMPFLASAINAQGIFAVFSGLFAITLLLTRYLPPPTTGFSVKLMQRPRFAAWIGMAAMFLYFVGLGVVWGYMEIIGERYGLASQVIASALAIATLAGGLGPVAAAILGSRWGRATPMLIALAFGLLALYLLGSPTDEKRYVVAACMFNFGWNFSTPFQIGSIAAADETGRVVGWGAAVSLAGMTVGPLIASLTIDGGLVRMLWLSAIVSMISFAGFLPVWQSANDRRN